MTFQQELSSWLPQSPTNVQSPPEINSTAPSSSKLPFPNPNGKPTIITFLRHCGCPFAEKTLLALRNLATTHPTLNLIAISHSSSTSTTTWLSSLGGSGPVQIIIDPEREIYAQWGLGTSSAWHVLNPRSMLSVFRLGREEKIWNRPTESGSRWQMSGSWVVDGEGIVKGGGVARSADDIMDFEEVVKLVEL
ncbi:2485c0fb-1e34-4d0d-ad63-495595e5ab1f [Sclerotinia trifoliorum]|uniref:2485c0fb-1e34-4d0d-ad63-495595e5ab1f n=1 Tax=Sclerotinia trifoliorum TaxID=28548 RepID=A0A8H2VPS4_9HELO|nr:2485c0fb-1e34-4d0d-ad63-495595e5ab1f [Sclerotinia trifoliorum]